MSTGAASWQALHDELECWRRDSRVATFWWRDDDAVTATPALQRLLALAVEHAVDVALAVIPARAEPALAECLRHHPARVAVLQHGFDHVNHAPAGEKRCELGDHRPVEAVVAELQRGWQHLTRLELQPHPMLVPPWNRIGSGVSAALPGQRWTALSAFGPRAPVADAALAWRNTHVDPIAWRNERQFAGAQAALAPLLRHLRARRLGAVDPDEATGLLTHHLVQDEDTWSFCGALLAATATHPAARWLAVGELLG